jgi:hypothetical protein
MFDVNVIGTLRMVQAFAPALARTSNSQYRSRILNIGTVITGGAPWHTGYASTKVSPGTWYRAQTKFDWGACVVGAECIGRLAGHERCHEARTRDCRYRRHHT